MSKKSLVVVLQIAHQPVFAEACVSIVERNLAALTLIFKRSNMWRQQTMQRKSIAFFFSKRSALIQARIRQKAESGQVGADYVIRTQLERRYIVTQNIFS